MISFGNLIQTADAADLMELFGLHIGQEIPIFQNYIWVVRYDGTGAFLVSLPEFPSTRIH